MKNFFLIIGMLFYGIAFSQNEIATDRPDQTETATILPKGRFQAETGFTHSRETENSDEFSLPSTLWKYGIDNRFEVRLITELVYYKQDDSLAQGVKPVVAGVKVNLWHGKGLLPETSLIAQMQLPNLASKNFKVEYLAPDLRLLFQNTLTDKIELGYNFGAIWDGEIPNPTYEYTISPSFKISNKFKVFVESFAYLLPHERPDHWVDAGLMFLLTKNIQLDFAYAYELSAHNHYHGYYETIGISFRI